MRKQNVVPTMPAITSQVSLLHRPNTHMFCPPPAPPSPFSPPPPHHSLAPTPACPALHIPPALTTSCCTLLELLVTRLEAMTQAYITNGRAPASVLEGLHEAIELLQIVCWCTDAWYLPTCHLANSSLLFAAVNHVLLWALAHTRQPQQLAALSERTDIAVSRVGRLCLRVFKQLPAGQLSAAVCKLPASLVPALACFLCERMWSADVMTRLAEAVNSQEGIIDWIVGYFGMPECTGAARTAMSQVLISPALLSWARMEFSAMMPDPSPSAAVRRRERASSRPWPPSDENAEVAWTQLVILEDLDGGRSLLSGDGGSTRNTPDLVPRSAVNYLAYMRALRIIACNTPATGFDARRTDRLTLGQQHDALSRWLGQRVVMGSVTARTNIQMVLPLAAFLSHTVLHWLRHEDAEGSGMQREQGDVQTMMKEIGLLVQQHSKGWLI